MKRGRRWVLFCLLALLVLTVGAAAHGDEACRQQWEVTCVGEEPAEEQVSLLAADPEGAEEALVAGMLEMRSEISIRQYRIPAEEFPAFTEHVSSNRPELFMARGCSYGISGGIVTTVYPKYTMSPEEYAAARAVFRDGVSAIVEQVEPEWSGVEQLLFVHDYIAAHYEYDMRVYDPALRERTVYDAYRFFEEGTGVCQAYTLAFMAAARELGFNVSYVESEHLNHIWNLVEVDGAWYHVDVTWDDPTEDRLGYARHSYFLLDDRNSWQRHKHENVNDKDTPGHRYDWAYGVETACRDGSYSDAFWGDALSPFVFEAGTGLWYFVDETGLRTWDGDKTLSEPVDVFGTIRTDVPGGYFTSADRPTSAGLSLYDGKLFYNSRYTVRSYDPKTGTAETLMTLDWMDLQGNRLSEKQCLLSLRVDDGTLSYETYSFRTGQQSRAELDVRSGFTSVGDGVYSYRLEEDALEVRVERGRVLVVSYDEKGAMLGITVCEVSGTYELPDGNVKLLAVDGETGWDPLCEAEPL